MPAGGMAERVGLPAKAAAGDSPFFNGLHLRVEADAAAWIATAGGQQRFWDRRGLGSGLLSSIGVRTGVAIWVWTRGRVRARRQHG